MNDDLPIDYEEMTGDDLLEVGYSQRDEIADLRQLLKESETELADALARLIRQGEDRDKVRGLLSDAENLIRNNPAPTHR